MHFVLYIHPRRSSITISGCLRLTFGWWLCSECVSSVAWFWRSVSTRRWPSGDWNASPQPVTSPSLYCSVFSFQNYLLVLSFSQTVLLYMEMTSQMEQKFPYLLIPVSHVCQETPVFWNVQEHGDSLLILGFGRWLAGPFSPRCCTDCSSTCLCLSVSHPLINKRNKWLKTFNLMKTLLF